MRAVIAEDLALLRDGLTRLLRDNDIEVIAAVDHPQALIDAVVLESPDIAIIDIRLPPTFRDEGLRAAIELRTRTPNTAILLVSQYVERTYTIELLADGRGGIGYLLKDRILDVNAFVDSIRHVAAGGTALDPELVAQLVRHRPDRTLQRLTPREQDVLSLMAEGKSNAGLAASLTLSTGAIEKHIASIFAKLDLPPSTNEHRRVLAVLTHLNEHI